jgi:hypothetical protein
MINIKDIIKHKEITVREKYLLINLMMNLMKIIINLHKN